MPGAVPSAGEVLWKYQHGNIPQVIKPLGRHVCAGWVCENSIKRGINVKTIQRPSRVRDMVIYGAYILPGVGVLGYKFCKSGSELALLAGVRITVLALAFCAGGGYWGSKLRCSRGKLAGKRDWLDWDSLRFMAGHRPGLWWVGAGWWESWGGVVSWPGLSCSV